MYVSCLFRVFCEDKIMIIYFVCFWAPLCGKVGKVHVTFDK